MKQRWKPTIGEKYFFIYLGYFNESQTIPATYVGEKLEERLYNEGNMFRTKKEAEAKLKSIRKVLKE